MTENKPLPYSDDEFKKAMGYVAMGVLGSLPSMGVVFLVVAWYDWLTTGNIYTIGWVIAGVTLPLTLLLWLIGRWLGGVILRRGEERRRNQSQR